MNKSARYCHKRENVFVSDFYENQIFSTDFLKTYQISNFIKIRPVGAELFYADGHDRR
jgi:hypothetical protein